MAEPLLDFYFIIHYIRGVWNTNRTFLSASVFQRYKHYIVTFGVELTILFLGFLVYRLANNFFSEVGFSEYTLSRRTISFIQPVLMMGLGVAIPRFSSLNVENRTYFPSGLTLILFFSFVLAAILNIGGETFAKLFFGAKHYVSLMLPLSLLLGGYGVHAVTYGFLRGNHNVYFANLIQLINVGIIPVAVFFLAEDVVGLIYWNSLLLLFTCAVASVIVLRKYAVKWTFKQFKTDAFLMLHYGLPRVPGDFALLALLTLPTYISLQLNNNIVAAGQIAYAITLLNMAGAAFGPISLVLLPEIAGFMSQERMDLVQKRFRAVVIISLVLTALGYLVFFLFTDFILKILLGNNITGGLPGICLLMLLSVFGYSLFIVLRSFLDAIKIMAVNALNLIIALAVYIFSVSITYYLKLDAIYYLLSFVVSVSFLGILTFIRTWHTLKNS